MTVNSAFAPILDAFVSGFNSQNGEFASEVNSYVAAHNAAKGEKVNPAKYFADSDNEDVRTLLEKYDKVKAALAQITESLQTMMDTDIAENSGNADSAKSWLEENQKAIREFNTARRQIIKSVSNFGMGDAEKEWLENELVSVSRPKGSAGNSGVKRPRFESITVNGDDLEKPTLTSLTNATKVSKDDIDRALYAAAGVDDVADFAGETIAFAITANDGEKFDVVAAPKKSAAPVEKSDDEKSDDVEPTDEEILAADAFDDEDED